ncbi:hypothetical protein PBY51_010749 [Eleginops maclovinus]|uniref:Uncharacterized protein n=2 Tax=Eleginops maclovinus TaxID=56733 RepID=A0AAN7XC80_ELEMC|nr:hypothetical protein PBY51_010749 [Eleginops maclovinus]
MPHKSKKEKETKSGRSKKPGSKNGPADDQDGSNKKVPPATQVMRVKQLGSHSAVKREKRFSTSSFPLSANRELQKLAALADEPDDTTEKPLRCTAQRICKFEEDMVTVDCM